MGNLLKLPRISGHNKTSIQWTPASNLSQQQQQKFWSKMIFEQQNQKNFPKKKYFFSEKNLGKIKFGNFFLKKQNLKELFGKTILIIFFLT